MGPEEAVVALRAEKLVVLPTDTVYGLCASARSAAAVVAAYRLKGRTTDKPSSLLAADVDTLLECIPELAGRAEEIARALLPGPYTLVLPNPARRYGWVCGDEPGTVGVRVPDLRPPIRRIASQAGLLVATSANLPGEREPSRAEDVPARIREGCAGVVDGGELPGTASTILDFTGPEPRVLREGAGPVEAALERAAVA